MNKHLAFLSVLIASGAMAATNTAYEVRGACSSSESWNFRDAPIRAEWRRDFEASLLPRADTLQSFANALAMRRTAESPEEKELAEYWMGRSLEKMGLIHLAHKAFGALATIPVGQGQPRAARVAALQCLTRLQERYPTLELPSGVSRSLGAYPKGLALTEAAAQEFRHRVGENAKRQELENLLTLMEDNHPQAALSRLWLAEHSGEHDKAVREGRAIFSAGPTSNVPDRFEDPARLLYGRSLYSMGKYDEALEELKKVRKQSNFLTRSLSDLAWAQLRADRHAEAVGTVINLQSGGLRRTFAPEAPMVMAMAFNELCHYPESLQALEYFKAAYAAPNAWLQKWKSEPKVPLYGKAAAFLRKEGDVPERVASEWIRSPHFIARQDEVKLYIDTEKAFDRTRTSARELQRKLASDLLTFVKELVPRYERVRDSVAQGAPLPKALEQDLALLKKKVTEYRRLKRAANPWARMVRAHSKVAPLERARIVREIDTELAALNLRMVLQLDEVAENLHFVEVEIYQGATQDIIWQNAHPDYKELVMTFEKKNRGDRARSWSWGNVSGGLAGTHEIWEDELGAFRADLPDNCSNKEKYLEVRSQRIGQLERRAE